MAANSLFNCSNATYYEANQCTACNSSCTMGCVRGTDCNLCTDPFCLNCTGYVGHCSSCVDTRALSSDFTCVCPTRYFLALNQCVFCDYSCDNCYGSSYYRCLTCLGSDLLLNGMCMKECPLGYVVNNTGCERKNSTLPVIKFVFDEIHGVYEDEINGIQALTGFSPQFYPDLDAGDPIPSNQRGLYFTGNSSFMSFPYNSISTPLFGQQFYISLWLNPSASSSIVLSYQSSEEMAFSIETIQFQASMQLTINSNTYLYGSNMQMLDGSWNQILACVDYENSTIVTIYTNGLQASPNIITSDPFKDSIGGLALLENLARQVLCTRAFLFTRDLSEFSYVCFVVYDGLVL
jgi:hypothetical protein